MADSFLSRWSQRKQQARSGEPPKEPVVGQDVAALTLPVPPSSAATTAAPDALPEPSEVPPPPPPTMEDVERLTAQSDFKPFVAPDVPPAVRNAAVRKLFTDPHYNVMDRLDTYIDDYSLPDPIPENMLRQLASARFLNLFEDQQDGQAGRAADPTADPMPDPLGDDADGRPVKSVPELGPPGPGVQLPAEQNPTDHDHIDLRLQQDDAVGPEGAGRSAERGADAPQRPVPP